MKLSSIIIAKNEEINIKRCIDSQLNCIDDIVVIIDKKSSDGTLEIVQSYENVNYEIIDWKGYSETKKYAVSQTLYDWILWIDADEEITNELCKELVEFKKTVPYSVAYSVARRAYFLGKWIKHSGWYPARVIRLFDKSKAYFSSNEVHEHLVVNGETGKLSNDIIHYTDPDIKHYFRKFNRYTSLAAEELQKNGTKAKLLDILFRPIFLFFKMFVLKAGFLDGLHGFILAVFSSGYVFTKYCKLWELNKLRKEK